MRDWSEHIQQQMHWLTGAGYNEELKKIRKKHRDNPELKLPDEVKVNTDERFFVVSNECMCFVIKLSAFNKMNKKQRDKLYAIANF